MPNNKGGDHLSNLKYTFVLRHNSYARVNEQVRRVRISDSISALKKHPFVMDVHLVFYLFSVPNVSLHVNTLFKNRRYELVQLFS